MVPATFGARRTRGPVCSSWPHRPSRATPGAAGSPTGTTPANTRYQPIEHEISPANAAQLAVKWSRRRPATSRARRRFRGRRGVLRRLRRHRLEARRGEHGRRDLVTPRLELHGARRRLRADEPVARREHAGRRDEQDAPAARHRRDDGCAALEDPGEPRSARRDDGLADARPATRSSPACPRRARRAREPPSAETIAAVDARTGQLLWRASRFPTTAASRGGYAGATMFSVPTVDVADGLVFGTFGNLYTEPATVARVPRRLAQRVLQRGLRAAGRVLEVDRRLQARHGRARLVVPRLRRPALAERVRPAAGALVRRGSSDVEKWDVGGSSPNVFQLGGIAHGRRLRRQERHLLPLRRENRCVAVEHRRRPRAATRAGSSGALPTTAAASTARSRTSTTFLTT